MNNKSKFFCMAFCAALALQWGCSSRYAVSGVERTQLLVDGRYDAAHDKAAWDFRAGKTSRKPSMARMTGKLIMT